MSARPGGCVRGLAATFALVAAMTLGAVTARAACVIESLHPGDYYTLTSTPYVGHISPWGAQYGWSVLEVTSAAGDDWDIGTYQTTAADPACVANPYATSTWGGDDVDFIVCDWPSGDWPLAYLKVNRFAGTQNATVEWDGTPSPIAVNGPLHEVNTNNVFGAEPWLITLTAGVTYTIVFDNAGAPGTRLSIYRNPGTGTYWTGRNGAIATATGSTTWTAPASGEYLFVITNDAHELGTYTFGVGVCQTPTALTSGTAVASAAGYQVWSITQTLNYWATVAVRGIGGAYTLELDRSSSGTGYMHCASDSILGSDRSDLVNFVVGDFNHAGSGTYYVQTLNTFYADTAVVEYEGGSQSLVVDGASASCTTGPTDVVRTWDVALTVGQTYEFTIASQGPNVHVLLFRNPGTGTYFATRANAIFDSRTCQSFTASSTDYYGVVAINEDGHEGTYQIGVSLAPCACPQTPSSGIAESPASPDAYYQLSPFAYGWSIVLARGQTTSDDWDLAVYSAPSGLASPVCFGNAAASSGFGPASVDVVALDLTSATSLPARWARVHHLPATSTTGRFLWFRNPTTLGENDPYVAGHFAPQDLGRVFDAYMTAGVTYTIDLLAASGVNALVFQNPGTGVWAGARMDAAAAGTGSFNYTPTITGHHAIVLVNDGIVDVSYNLHFGRCTTPTPLANGTAQATTKGQETYSFTAPNANWLAAGVLSNWADWDMRVGTSLGSPWPSCAANVFVNSTLGGTMKTDFVMGDFHHAATGGTYVFNAQQYTAPPLSSTYVSVDQGGATLTPNLFDAQPVFFADWEAVRALDLTLNGGETYTFSLKYNGYHPRHMRLMLFRNPGAGSYWAGRSSAVLDLASDSAAVTYTAPATDVYGVALVDDPGGDGYPTDGPLMVSVRSCPTPVALPSNATRSAQPTGWFTFTPAAHYWTAVGVRAATPWTMEVDSLATGGAPGVCFGTLLSQSTSVGKMSFVVGDMNNGANPLRTYYARAGNRSPSTPVDGTVQWTGTAQSLSVNTAPVARTAIASRLLEVWDVYLYAGDPYQVWLDNKGAATLKACVFANPTGGSCWLPRSSALVETATSATFTAPRTGWYAVVVANDDGGTGAYTIGVYGGALGADTAPPAVTGLRNVAPNPAAGAFTVEFALHDAASVTLEVLDMAGRRVATLADGPRDAGTWRVPLEGARIANGSLRPGVYFVRLQADGRTVGEKKLVLLR